MAAPIEEAVNGADVIFIGKRVPGVERLAALRLPKQTIVDLVGVDGIAGALRPWASASNGVAASRPVHG